MNYNSAMVTIMVISVVVVHIDVFVIIMIPNDAHSMTVIVVMIVLMPSLDTNAARSDLYAIIGERNGGRERD